MYFLYYTLLLPDCTQVPGELNRSLIIARGIMLHIRWRQKSQCLLFVISQVLRLVTKKTF